MTMTTAIEEMRLECLRLAMQVSTSDNSVTQIVEFARDFWDFVNGAPVPDEPPADFGGGTEDPDRIFAMFDTQNDADAEIEAVARAIASDTGYEPFPDGQEWIDWTSEARAAIAALDHVRAEAARRAASLAP